MNAFEVVLPGFDGSTDETDNKILWGLADNEQLVRKEYPGADVYQLTGKEMITYTAWDFTLTGDKK